MTNTNFTLTFGQLISKVIADELAAEMNKKNKEYQLPIQCVYFVTMNLPEAIYLN
jgi:hypothetical protein